ncbi:MAG: hypothetical protein R6X16_09820 [Anaerolineae bacterium]
MPGPRRTARQKSRLFDATHDMRLAWELCPRTVILDRGRVLATAPAASLLRDEALLSQYGLKTPFWSAANPAMADPAW